jgi:hypothetical protein
VNVKGIQSLKDLPRYAAHIGAIRYIDSLREDEPELTWKSRLLKLFLGGRHES